MVSLPTRIPNPVGECDTLATMAEKQRLQFGEKPYGILSRSNSDLTLPYIYVVKGGVPVAGPFLIVPLLQIATCTS